MRRKSVCGISILINKVISTNERLGLQMPSQNVLPKSTCSVGLAAKHLQDLRCRDLLAGAALVDGRWIVGEQRDLVVDPATGRESWMFRVAPPPI